MYAYACMHTYTHTASDVEYEWDREGGDSGAAHSSSQAVTGAQIHFPLLNNKYLLLLLSTPVRRLQVHKYTSPSSSTNTSSSSSVLLSGGYRCTNTLPPPPQVTSDTKPKD